MFENVHYKKLKLQRKKLIKSCPIWLEFKDSSVFSMKTYISVEISGKFKFTLRNNSHVVSCPGRHLLPETRVKNSGFSAGLSKDCEKGSFFPDCVWLLFNCRDFYHGLQDNSTSLQNITLGWREFVEVKKKSVLKTVLFCKLSAASCGWWLVTSETLRDRDGLWDEVRALGGGWKKEKELCWFALEPMRGGGWPR